MSAKVDGTPARKINDRQWFYAEARQLTVVAEVLNRDGDLLRTEIIEIPWSMIDAARTVKSKMK